MSRTFYDLETRRNGIKPARCGGVEELQSLALPSILVSLLTLAPPSAPAILFLGRFFLFYSKDVFRQMGTE
jgi:hypothetical protein